MPLFIIIPLLVLIVIYVAVVLAVRSRRMAPNYLLLAHACVWLGISIYAFSVAGSYRFFNCWPIILAYVPLTGLGLLVVFGIALYWVWRGWSGRVERHTTGYQFASNVLLLVVGLFTATISAALGAAENPSCL